MSRRRALGRGLDALLSSTPSTESAAPAVTEIAVDALLPNRHQPRRIFEDSALEELAASIREQGVIQPILATRQGDDLVIIAGERRWRAARIAGLETVPVVFREVADDQSLAELALIENIQREDLTAVEEAEAFEVLNTEYGLTQSAIAKRVGKARATVTNALRLLRLPPEVLDLIRSGELTAGQARPLLALPRAQQRKLAERASGGRLSARQIEELAQKMANANSPAQRRKKASGLDIHARRAQERLMQHLQTRVEIKKQRRGGYVKIAFHSEDELMRIYETLLGRTK